MKRESPEQSPVKGEKETNPAKNEDIFENWSGSVEEALDTKEQGSKTTTSSASVGENINSIPSLISDILPAESSSSINSTRQPENLNSTQHTLGNVSQDRILLDSIERVAGRVTEAIDSAVSRPASKKENSRSKPIKSVTDSINDVSKKMKEGISTRNARKAIEKLGKTKVTVQLDGANRISDQIEQPKKKSPIQPSKYELFNFWKRKLL